MKEMQYAKQKTTSFKSLLTADEQTSFAFWPNAVSFHQLHCNYFKSDIGS